MAAAWDHTKMNEEPLPPQSTKPQLRYIYDSYRTALLNRKYYGYRLTRYQSFNSAMDIAIAIGATGSGGVAGLAVWGTITGQYAWLWISGVATIVGVIKPILQLGVKIENYTKLFTGHGSIYLELKAVGGLDDPKPDKKLIKQLQSQVNDEIPPDTLWTPS
jgi:hypothetical protein